MRAGQTARAAAMPRRWARLPGSLGARGGRRRWAPWFREDAAIAVCAPLNIFRPKWSGIQQYEDWQACPGSDAVGPDIRLFAATFLLYEALERGVVADVCDRFAHLAPQRGENDLTRFARRRRIGGLDTADQFNRAFDEPHNMACRKELRRADQEVAALRAASARSRPASVGRESPPETAGESPEPRRCRRSSCACPNSASRVRRGHAVHSGICSTPACVFCAQLPYRDTSLSSQTCQAPYPGIFGGRDAVCRRPARNGAAWGSWIGFPLADLPGRLISQTERRRQPSSAASVRDAGPAFAAAAPLSTPAVMARRISAMPSSARRFNRSFGTRKVNPPIW